MECCQKKTIKKKPDDEDDGWTEIMVECRPLDKTDSGYRPKMNYLIWSLKGMIGGFFLISGFAVAYSMLQRGRIPELVYIFMITGAFIGLLFARFGQSERE